MTMHSSAPPPQAEATQADIENADWRTRLRGSRYGTLIVLAITAALVCVGAYLVKPGGASGPEAAAATGGGVQAVELTGTQSGPAPAVGAPAPDFSATTVDGRTVSLADYRGRPVWLTFGASWCSACRVEAPDIQAAYEARTASGLAVLAVYLSEDAMDVKTYTDRLSLRYVHIPDPQTTLASAYRVMGVPAHVFIDRQGVIRSIQVGILSPERIDSAIAQID